MCLLYLLLLLDCYVAGLYSSRVLYSCCQLSCISCDVIYARWICRHPHDFICLDLYFVLLFPLFRNGCIFIYCVHSCNIATCVIQSCDVVFCNTPTYFDHFSGHSCGNVSRAFAPDVLDYHFFRVLSFLLSENE